MCSAVYSEETQSTCRAQQLDSSGFVKYPDETYSNYVLNKHMYTTSEIVPILIHDGEGTFSGFGCCNGEHADGALS